MSDALAARHVQNFVEFLAFVLAEHSYLDPWPWPVEKYEKFWPAGLLQPNQKSWTATSRKNQQQSLIEWNCASADHYALSGDANA